MDMRKKINIATLIFLVRGDEVLLARKSRKVGIGLWNGYGGGQNEGETVRQSAVREFKKESGLQADPSDLEYSGVITFHNEKDDGWKFDVVVHVFLLHQLRGKERASIEMTEPTWWPIKSLPLGDMMASDKYWVSLVLNGKLVEGEVWMKGGQRIMTRPPEIRIVQKLDDIDYRCRLFYLTFTVVILYLTNTPGGYKIRKEGTINN